MMLRDGEQHDFDLTCFSIWRNSVWVQSAEFAHVNLRSWNFNFLS